MTCKSPIRPSIALVEIAWRQNGGPVPALPIQPDRQVYTEQDDSLMRSAKSNPGRFFEDFSVGMVIEHPTPRTVTNGDRSLCNALFPFRHALFSSDEFARRCGLPQAPIEDFAVFHFVFGKSVPDISVNAVANLGYAEMKFRRMTFAGDTLTAQSEVIGIKENSNGKSGIVWVRTKGSNQHGQTVVDFVRWVMVRKRRPGKTSGVTLVPEINPCVEADALPEPPGLDFSDYDFTSAGEPHSWSDYLPGETINHEHGTTVEEAEHMIATRLWQNPARVHFDSTLREDGRRLIYGGHVISIARALSFNGLANAQTVLAVNSGKHVNPCFAGTTVRAWSKVLERAKSSVPGAGALRIRTLASSARTGAFPDESESDAALLDLDYWVLIPR